MAATGTVGILRALLTADASTFQATMKQSAVVAGKFGDTVSKVGDTAQKVTPQLTRMEKAFSGDKLLYTANNLTAAVGKIGGAAKLTTKEQERVNRSVTEAIEKYRALGKEAPAAMLALQKATTGATQPTSFLTTKMIALGTAVGTFASQMAMQAVRALGSFAVEAFDTAGQIIDLSKATGLTTDTIQEMQAVADQTGTDLEAFTTAAYKLGIAIAGGGPSVVKAFRALGLELEALRAMSPDQQWRATIKALEAVQNETERNRIAQMLFSKTWKEIAAGVVGGYTEIADAAHKSTRAQLEALDRAGDAWDGFVTNLKGTIRSNLGQIVLFGQAVADIIKEGGVFQSTAKVIAEAQARVAMGITGKGKGDIELKPRISTLRDYVAELEAARLELGKLDAAQRAQVKAAQDAGADTEEVTELLVRYGVSAGQAAAVLKLLTGEQKASETATEKQARAMEQLGLVTEKTAAEELHKLAIIVRDAVAGGADMNKAIVAILPKLIELGDKAAASGVKVKGLSENIKAAIDLWVASIDKTKGTNIADLVIGDSEDFRRKFQIETPFAFAHRLEVDLFELGEQAKETQKILSPEEFDLSHIGPAMERAGFQSKRALQSLAAEAEIDYAVIVRAVGKNAPQAVAAYKRMIDAQKLAQKGLLTFWDREFPEVLEDAGRGMVRSWSDALGDMLTGTRGFKETFIEIWRSIQRAISNILSSILNEFIGSFLRGLLGALRGQQGAFAAAFGNLITGGASSAIGALVGGGAAFGVAPAVSSAAGAANAASLGWTLGGAGGGTAAGGAAAGGAGFGGSLLALASNPITWGVAAGALLTWGITKKGWFRGGEEGVQVNPARDRYLAKWGPPGTGEGSGFANLAALLTRLTGEPGGGRLFAALAHAQTMKAFTTAVTNIETLLARRGVPSPQMGGRQRMPLPELGAAGRTPLPALSLAASSATLPAPAAIAPTAIPSPAAALAAGGGTINMNLSIQAWDRADLNDAFRTEIIPRLKDAIAFNQSGLRTTIAGVG